MPTSRPLRLEPERDGRFGRMIGLSTLAHAAVVVLLVVAGERSGYRPPPMVAYTVEITDPNALGGRLPPGPRGPDLSGGPTRPPAPEPKAEPPPPPPEAKPAEAAKAESVPPPEPPKPPEAKPEPKVEPAKPEPPPPEPVKVEPPKPEPPKVEAPAPEPPKPEPPKVEPSKPEPPKPAPAKPEPPKLPPPKAESAKPEPPKAASAKPAAPSKPETKPATAKPEAPKPGTATEGPPRDAYGAAAERWRTRAGGGLGGTDQGSGPIGAGGEGKGGGGQLVGLEFLAYRQTVINTIKGQWTNVIARPGLVASVRFEIGPDGEVSNVRLAQPSGNPAYDASAVRAVQHTTKLPPPPARYANEFREFVIEFHSEETGGQGTG